MICNQLQDSAYALDAHERRVCWNWNSYPFADLKKDTVESPLIHFSDRGLNIRMFLNGDSIELDLIKNLKGYEVTFIDHRDKEPAQVNEISELIQILNIT